MNAGGEPGAELFEDLLEGWSVEEARAIHEFCQRLSDRLWERYEQVLIEHMLELDRVDVPLEPSGLADERTLPLPFIEPEPPF